MGIMVLFTLKSKGLASGNPGTSNKIAKFALNGSYF